MWNSIDRSVYSSLNASDCFEHRWCLWGQSGLSVLAKLRPLTSPRDALPWEHTNPPLSNGKDIANNTRPSLYRWQHEMLGMPLRLASKPECCGRDWSEDFGWNLEFLDDINLLIMDYLWVLKSIALDGIPGNPMQSYPKSSSIPSSSGRKELDCLSLSQPFNRWSLTKSFPDYSEVTQIQVSEGKWEKLIGTGNGRKTTIRIGSRWFGLR